MTMLCTICARGGSKGVVGKNSRDLLGKPLLAWTIEQARQTGLFKAIAFSSDSDLLLETALKAGADIAVKRPEEMATDTAPKLPAIRHCLEQAIARTGMSPEIFVDLDVTSPLRLPSDITGAVDLLRNPAPAMSSPARRRTGRPISTWSRRGGTAASACPRWPILPSSAGRMLPAAST